VLGLDSGCPAYSIVHSLIFSPTLGLFLQRGYARINQPACCTNNVPTLISSYPWFKFMYCIEKMLWYADRALMFLCISLVACGYRGNGPCHNKAKQSYTNHTYGVLAKYSRYRNKGFKDNC